MRKCEYCGTPLPYDVDRCPGCGARCEIVKDPAKTTFSERINVATDKLAKKLSANNNRAARAIAMFVVCLCFGMIGVHRFMEGKIVTGLLWMFTGGLFLVGYIVDAVNHGKAVARALRDGAEKDNAIGSDNG